MRTPAAPTDRGTRLVVAALAVFGSLALAVASSAQNMSYTTSSRDALALFRAGIELDNNLYQEAAAEQFERALAIDPRFAMAHLYYALGRANDSYADYRTHLDQAIAMTGEVTEGERLLISAHQARDENRPADAERLFRRLQALYPGDVQTHLQISLSSFGTGDYHAAAEQLEAAILLDDEFPPAYNQLGYCYAFMGNFDAAITTLKAYASLIPDEPNPHDSLGEVYLMAGQFDEAIARYTRALELDPAFYSSYLGRGHAYLLMDQRDRALVEYRKMREVAPTAGVARDALRWEGIAQAYFDDFDLAAATLEEVRGEARSAGEIISAGNRAIDLGWLHLAAGGHDAAIAAMEDGWQYVMSSGDLPEVAKKNYARRHHVVHGIVLARSGDTEGAHSVADRLHRLVDLSEDIAEWEDFNWLMGEIRFVEEDYKSALAHLIHAPAENPRVIYLTGQACDARGLRDEAQRHRERVEQFNRMSLLYAMTLRDMRHPTN